MCGFAGVLGFTPNNKNIQQCISGLKSRGPDDYGKYSDKDITLVHTRLSIIDLTDNAKQPMVNQETGVVLAFNGEIYNYRELIRKHNLDIKNNSDTKVILHMYLKIGLEFVSELNGMFAICIWDPRYKSLYLIRDRFGIKPLYIYEENKKYIFGSDLNAIFNLGAKKIPNLYSIKRYLKYGLTENNKDTFFENIEAISTGSIFSIKSNDTSLKKYWKLKNNINTNKFANYSNNDLTNFIQTNLKDSINSHLISDVPIGLTLSSGLDSKVILNYMLDNKKILNLKTFTYGYDEDLYDESKEIKNIYNNSRLTHHNTKLKSNNLISELSKAVNYFQSPLGGLGTLSLFHLMKLIRKNNVKVILSGEGADEVFAGYKYYFYSFLLDLKYNNDFERLETELKFWKSQTGEDLKDLIKENNLLSNMAFGMMAPDGTNLSSQSLEGELLQSIDVDPNFILDIDKNNNLKNLRYEDIFTKKLPKLLMFQDRCSMYSSVESRVPFLDHKLVENIFSIKPTQLIQNGELKFLLRQNINNVKRNKIIENQKKYVATPQREWLKNVLYKDILSEILDSNLQKKGLVNLKKFEEEYRKYFLSKNLGNSFFIWKILNIKYLFDN